MPEDPCRHNVSFNTAAVAESSLKRWTNREPYEVIECPRCHWFLILRKDRAADPPAVA
jgi:hypothetical protein